MLYRYTVYFHDRWYLARVLGALVCAVMPIKTTSEVRMSCALRGSINDGRRFAGNCGSLGCTQVAVFAAVPAAE